MDQNESEDDLGYIIHMHREEMFTNIQTADDNSGSNNFECKSTEMLVAYRDCSFINALGSVIKMVNGAAFLCDNCKIYAGKTLSTKGYTKLMKEIQSELPKGETLLKYMTEATVAYFAFSANKEKGAINLEGVSNQDSNKLIKGGQIKLKKDYLAYEKDQEFNSTSYTTDWWEETLSVANITSVYFGQNGTDLEGASVIRDSLIQNRESIQQTGLYISHSYLIINNTIIQDNLAKPFDGVTMMVANSVLNGYNNVFLNNVAN